MNCNKFHYRWNHKTYLKNKIYLSHNLCKIYEQQLHYYHKMQLMGGGMAAKSSYIWTPLLHFNKHFNITVISLKQGKEVQLIEDEICGVYVHPIN